MCADTALPSSYQRTLRLVLGLLAYFLVQHLYQSIKYLNQPQRLIDRFIMVPVNLSTTISDGKPTVSFAGNPFADSGAVPNIRLALNELI